MLAVSSRARRRALLAATAIACAPAAFAADTTIPSGTTRTAPLTMSGTDRLTIDQGGAISTGDDPSVVLRGKDSDLAIDNGGTISSSDGRAIRTRDSAGSFSLTLTNREGALIEGVDDAIGINRALGGGSVVLRNSGTIRTTTDGQALDFNPATGGSVFITNDSTGVIEANGVADVARPGENAIITNYGAIRSMDDGAWNGSEWDRGDAIDFQAAGSGSVDNHGTVSGAKHGITGDTGTAPFWITNEAGGAIIGRNGSGINFDIPENATPEEIDALAVARIANYGMITGAALDRSGPDHWDTDGDGVDIDYRAYIANYGTIQALGALGYKDFNPDDPNISDAISIGGGGIVNGAGALIYSVGRGILVDDSEGGSAYGATAIRNDGVITSEIGQAITLRGNFDDWIDNSGVINGNVDMGGGDDLLQNSGAINGGVALGAGDDSVELAGGSSITGTLDGGDGSDDLTVWAAAAGTATLRGVVDFEALDIASGNWTLGDNEAYADGVTVGSGAGLAVDTVLAAVTTVEGGATLSGSGSVAGLVTTGLGAVIMPGTGSAGALTVDGDASLDGATLKIGMAADGASSRLAVTGAATINGGSVALDLAPGPYVVGTTATILTAAGGVRGSGFSSLLAPSFLFIEPTLGMSADAVTVSLYRNDVPFARFAETQNERAVANALDIAAPTSALYGAVVNSATTAGLAPGYDSLSGAIHADLAGTLLDQAGQTELSLLDRLRRIGVPAGKPAADAKLSYGEEQTTSTAAFDALTANGTRYSAWAQGFGSWLNRDGDGNAGSASSSVGGGLVGADFSGDSYTFGLAGGYSSGSTDSADWQGSADIDTGLLAIYGGAAFDAVRLRGGASMGWSAIDTSRIAAIGDIIERPQASYNATTGNIFGELAYEAAFGSAVVEPYAGLGWVSVSSDDFTETNAPLTGLSSGGLSYDTAYSTLGARFSTSFLVNGTAITPRGMLGWRHAFDDVSPEVAALFSNTATGFTVAGTPIATDSLLVEAGADVAFSETLSVGFTYAGSFAGGADSNAVKLSGLLKF